MIKPITVNGVEVLYDDEKNVVISNADHFFEMAGDPNGAVVIDPEQEIAMPSPMMNEENFNEIRKNMCSYVRTEPDLLVGNFTRQNPEEDDYAVEHGLEGIYNITRMANTVVSETMTEYFRRGLDALLEYNTQMTIRAIQYVKDLDKK